MNWERATHVSGVVSTALAAVALVWSVVEFRTQADVNRRVLEDAIEQQKESSAVELYNSYLTLAFSNPSFVFEEKSILQRPESEGQQYTVFATAAVNIAERIYVLRAPNALWIKTVDSILASHHNFIVANIGCKDAAEPFITHLKASVNGFTCS